jgi:hypothetical protein
VIRRTATVPSTGGLTATKIYLQASGCHTELDQHKDFVVDVGANAGTFVRTKKGCATAADIYPFETRIYYVSNETIPTLRLLTISGTSSNNEPLVQGIEDLRVEYGRDNVGSDGAADTFRKCLSTGPVLRGRLGQHDGGASKPSRPQYRRQRRVHRYQDVHAWPRVRRGSVQ